jgi:hypothetical protein
MLLVQGTTVPGTTTVSTTPLQLKDSVHDFPRSMLQPKVSGPISIDLNRSSRASYQTLADIAGLNILFDPDFRDSSLAPAHLENVDIFDALDRVSASTKNFVEVMDSKTILVSPDNATKRRQHELQVIKTIYLANANSPQDLSGAATKLRTALNVRYIATYSDMKAIVIRDTPDRVSAAEKLLAESDKVASSEPIAIDGAGNLFVPDGANIKKSSPARSQLQVGPALTTSIDMNDRTTTEYDALAAMAGLNILFDQDFRNAGPISLKVENVSVFDALDFLGFETRAFWTPVDSKTILVSPDNQVKRRDYQQLLLKTVYLGGGATQTEISQIITAFRTLFNMRYLSQVSGTHGIAMMDTPTQIALAEKIMTDLGMGGSLQKNSGVTLEVGEETGGVLRTRVVRSLSQVQSQLNLRTAGKISVDLNATARNSFETIAEIGGLHVTFDERLKDSPAQPFAVNDVSILDALDFLSLQTKTFWLVLDNTTILVAPDNQTVRRDRESLVEKVIHLNHTPTEGGAREIVIALRTLLNIRDIETADKAIVIKAELERVTLAEKIVADLDR